MHAFYFILYCVTVHTLYRIEILDGTRTLETTTDLIPSGITNILIQHTDTSDWLLWYPILCSLSHQEPLVTVNVQ